MRKADDTPAGDPGTLPLAQRAGTGRDLCLLVVDDDGARTIPLASQGLVTLGRGADNAVRIAHRSVSRQHAVLHVGPALAVEDVGSVNGVVVRDRRLAPGERAVLALGEVAQLGSVVVVVQRADDRAAGAARVATRRDPGAQPPGDRAIVVQDPAMRELHALVARVAQSPVSVLLLGETGVGKEIVAEAIHARSPRAHKPLLRLNSGALAPALLESELFGHERGAFTGAAREQPGLLEAADGGTVFLDEVGELPLAAQVKLLRVLEDRTVLRVGGRQPRAIDVRFVAATNRDLRAEIARGAFRQDLYFRLNGVELVVPPLRERVGEIGALARAFVARACAAFGRDREPALADAALSLLERYAWPGNVRELRNVIERAVLLGDGGAITPASLPREIAGGATPPSGLSALAAFTLPADPSPGASGTTLSPAAAAGPDADERQRIVDALARCSGNQTRAAKLLGVPLRTLVAKLTKYDLPRPRKGGPGGAPQD